MKQTKKIMTNELLAKFNYAKINQDYDFYIGSTEQSKIAMNAEFLDFNDLEKINALVFATPIQWVIMTKKAQVTCQELVKNTQLFVGPLNISITQKQAQEIEKNILIQLFLSTLSQKITQPYIYNNLSGKIFVYHPSWIIKNNVSLDCLQISVDTQMYLHLDACKFTTLRYKNKMVFTKHALTDYPQYEWTKQRHLCRVKQSNQGRTTNLIQKAIKGKQGKIAFLDIASQQTFEKTKMGILYNLFLLIDKEFNQYFKLSFKSYQNLNPLHYQLYEITTWKDALARKVLEKGVALLDLVQNSDSQTYLQELMKALQRLYPSVDCILAKKTSNKRLNLRYVHNREVYHPDSEGYEIKFASQGVHPLTQADFDVSAKATIETLLKDMIVKEDLNNNRLTLIDWQSFGFKDDWWFMLQAERKHYAMIIHPDGTFEITSDCARLLGTKVYAEFLNPEVLCAFKDDLGNINLIKDVGLQALPDFNALGKLFDEAVMSNEINSTWLNNFFKRCLDLASDDNIRQEILANIQEIDYNQEYTIKELVRIFNKAEVRQILSKVFYEQTEKYLYPYLRDQIGRTTKNKELIDIEYIQVSMTKGYYCIGVVGGGLRTRVTQANIIREIIAINNGPLLVEKLFNFTGMEFVRFGMLTVIPFPFKYLCEYFIQKRKELK